MFFQSNMCLCHPQKKRLKGVLMAESVWNIYENLGNVNSVTQRSNLESVEQKRLATAMKATQLWDQSNIPSLNLT